MSEDETVELDLDLVHETDLAWVVDDGDGHRVALPKSRCEKLGTGKFDVPVWIAEKEGLI